LPFARPKPDPYVDPAEGFVRWGLDPRHSEALDRIGRSAGATYYTTRLAAFSALVALESEVEDFVIGTPVSTRIRAELQNMIGVFVNFAALRLRFTGEPTFRSWLGEVRRAVIDTGAHVTVPAEQLTRELGRRNVRPPRTEARFVAWAAIAPMRFGGIELEPLPRRGAEASGFRLGVNRPYESERCWAEFDPKVHDRSGVEQFLAHLTGLVAAACAEPDRSLRDLHAAVALL
jgi:hypothetical protein